MNLIWEGLEVGRGLSAANVAKVRLTPRHIPLALYAHCEATAGEFPGLRSRPSTVRPTLGTDAHAPIPRQLVGWVEAMSQNIVATNACTATTESFLRRLCIKAVP